MNILPKKKWHVRTKENIARVRKDEAEAAEKEKQENLRIENADREARLSVLKNKSKQKLLEAGIPEPTVAEPASEHINLFADYDNAHKNTNKEHDSEVKEKKEDYEKKIGYLTYLGQDTNESLKKKNWYEVAPETSRFSRTDEIKETYNKLVLKDEDGRPKHSSLDIHSGEISWKSKQRLDPIHAFKKYCHEKIKKSTNDSSRERSKKDTSNDKKDKLLKLREARLKREREEKYKTEMFLTKLNGTANDTSASSSTEPETNRVKPKYNSQFNPELARQNYR
ncbi:Leukocyte receptor cluster member 1 [Operophtera brumata]|uniref:Leukocyte receptor cluster member 1 n=1 Tax=Operophtera brumata TaxID=104452 RepID=A0A0L7L9R1_OPEBR|nr:Leukocyte receptor cluster member 1 [Operophtera brumata]